MDTFDPNAHKDKDFVEVQALDVDSPHRCGGYYPRGPEAVRYDLQPGELGAVPWALAKRWLARKIAEPLSEETVEPPTLQPPPPVAVNLASVRAAAAAGPPVAEAKEENLALAEGDLVQWVSDGVEQWQRRKRITRIEEDEGQSFAFFDGSDTGIQISELQIGESSHG